MISRTEQTRIKNIIQKHNLPTKTGFNAYNWKGTIVKNIKTNKIGWVTDDLNVFYRELTVMFPNKKTETIMLSNIGPNPESSKKYRYYDYENKEWCGFGW